MWLYVFIALIALIIYFIIANHVKKNNSTQSKNTLSQKQNKIEDNLGGLKIYIDEVDENGEPW